jgi:hypothetical protein
MKTFMRSQADWICAITAVLFFAVLLLIRDNPLTLDDGLRHMAMGKLMAERGMLNVNGWSEFFYEGYLSNLKTDPWFLSDVLYRMFASLPGLIAIKAFTLMSVCALAASGILVFRSLKLSPMWSAVFTALLLFGEQTFTMRMLIGRPFTLMTAVILFAIWAITDRRDLLIGVLMLFSVLLSQLFVFPLMIACIAIFSLFLRSERNRALLLTLYVFMGLVLGFCLHPQAGEYLLYLHDVFLKIPFLDSEASLSTEMQPGIWVFSLSILVILLASALLIACDIPSKTLRSFHRTQVFFPFMCAVAFLVLYIFWIRAIDVLWPLSLVLFASLAVRHWKEFLAAFHFFIRSKVIVTLFLGLCAFQVCAVPIWFYMNEDTKDLSAYAAIEDIEPGSRVLNMDWQRFAVYVFLRPDLTYATGIDPVFTYDTDPRVTRILLALRDDVFQKENAPAMLRELMILYPSDYIVMTEVAYAKAADTLETMQGLEKISSSREIRVFRIL